MNQKFFSLGPYEINLNHFLIILILSLSFSISFLIRSLPGDFGWELNEFDPFFNYRATSFIIENGIEKYFLWNDELSWYPYGRDVSSNSQVLLHITTAVAYWIFGSGQSVYDFVILFPIIIGSLTSIVIFALVRIIGGTTAGLISSLLFSISLPIMIRGQIGWFKSEPLGLFYGLLATYLFLSAINSKNFKKSIPLIISSAILTIFGISSWGGNQFFLIPIGLLIFCLPFTRKDHKFLVISVSLFTSMTIIASLGLERPGLNYLTGLSGMSIIIPTLFLIISSIIKSFSKKETILRNTSIFLIILIISSLVIIFFPDSSVISLPTHRYLNAIFPFLTTSDPLTDSVSEHATLSTPQSFQFHLFLLVFSGIGVWLLLTKSNFIKKEMLVYSLTLGLFGVHISSAFMRLEVFSAISLIVLSSLGLSILINNITTTNLIKNKNFYKILKTFTITGIFFFLLVPLFLPESSTVFAVLGSNPPTILNGGTGFSIGTNDWIETLSWIKNNTPQNSVIGSWWDYGYWIQVFADRASLIDNSTLISHRISTVSQVFFESPDDAWKSLNQMETDYFVIFIAAEKLMIETESGEALYALRGGGDESKIFWFTKIAGVPTEKYLNNDYNTPTEILWNETFLGKIIPYKILGFVSPDATKTSTLFQMGWVPVYQKEIKYFSDDDPFKLVYSSTSYDEPKNNIVIGVFVYEVNKNYLPIDSEWDSPVILYPNQTND
jgi:dolichyl-diphosphooligosaccharide--protein glycosyltransferase